jgi:type III pantothenate kinase
LIKAEVLVAQNTASLPASGNINRTMPETYLLVDAGNTRIKVALTIGGNITDRYNWAPNEAFSGFKELARTCQPRRCMVSSTRMLPFSLSEIFPDISITELAPGQVSGLKLAYHDPNALGKDRLAALLGALATFPGESLCIADAGTCLTLDFLLPGGLHLGGFISPGLSMRLLSMHQGTENLPLATPDLAGSFLGTDTLSCLAGGAIWGMVSEIQTHQETMAKAYSLPFKVLLTGGDANFLAQRLKHPTFVVPDLVFSGLYEALTNPA